MGRFLEEDVDRGDAELHRRGVYPKMALRALEWTDDLRGEDLALVVKQRLDSWYIR